MHNNCDRGRMRRCNPTLHELWRFSLRCESGPLVGCFSEAFLSALLSSVLQAKNATHLHWQRLQTAPPDPFTDESASWKQCRHLADADDILLLANSPEGARSMLDWVTE